MTELDTECVFYSNDGKNCGKPVVRGRSNCKTHLPRLNHRGYLIERLRELQVCDHDQDFWAGCCGVHPIICDEAAEEIKRLNDQLLDYLGRLKQLADIRGDEPGYAAYSNEIRSLRFCQCDHPQTNHVEPVLPDGGSHDGCDSCACDGFEIA